MNYIYSYETGQPTGAYVLTTILAIKYSPKEILNPATATVFHDSAHES